MTWPFGDLRPLSYDVLAVDPGWNFRNWSAKGEKKSAKRHYRCMPLAEIMALPVSRLAQRDCLVLLWATAPMLPQALACMASWGVPYKTNIVWRKVTPSGKVRMGPGYWARTMHEQVLIGTIGKPKKVSAFPSIFDGVARDHSRKPEEFYALVEKHTVGLRRADVFSRTDRPGWDAFGDAKGKYNDARERPATQTLQTAAELC